MRFPIHQIRGWNQNAVSMNMWIAAMRLSRWRTWQSSCAMTACNCAGVRRSVIPSGSKRMGRKTPKTPGSMRVGEEVALIGRWRCNGDAARTADWRRIQRIHHDAEMPINPQAQMPKRIDGSGMRAGGVFAGSGAENAGVVNGWLTSMMKGVAGVVVRGGAFVNSK